MTSQNVLSSTELRNSTVLPPLSSVSFSALHTNDTPYSSYPSDSTSASKDLFTRPASQSPYKAGTIGFMLQNDTTPYPYRLSGTESSVPPSYSHQPLPSRHSPQRSNYHTPLNAHPYSISNITHQSSRLELPSTSESSSSPTRVSSRRVLITPERSIKPNQKGVYPCVVCRRTFNHRHGLYHHQWEHSQYMQVVNDPTLSKLQQVQILEAAHILYGISGTNGDLYA